MIKKYYRITFELVSPLSIGCGENNLTDSDLIRDSRGIPYIPGTALAGVYRQLFSKTSAEAYFGPDLTQERILLAAETGKNPLWESEVRVYDAYMINPGKRVLGKRDMVALDEYKTAVEGAKFDFEILEPGAVFVTYIEQTMEREDQQYVCDELAFAWICGEIQLGAKTGRGYGYTRGLQADAATFHLDVPDELEKWLDFDMYKGPDSKGDSLWKSAGTPFCLSGLNPENPEYVRISEVYRRENIFRDRKNCRRLTLTLRQKGGISIRQYSTDVGDADYKQLTRKWDAHSGKTADPEGVPVIPGTSWAGAFRAQIANLDPDFGKNRPLASLFFGRAKERGVDSSRSRIAFSESAFSGGTWITYTRNAIDRFTGGTVDGALYTEKTYYNGSTELEISCDFTGLETKDTERFARIMAAAVLDLHNGYLSVGGLTAAGRGIFRIEKLMIDGKAFSLPENGEKVYEELADAISGKEEG